MGFFWKFEIDAEVGTEADNKHTHAFLWNAIVRRVHQFPFDLIFARRARRFMLTESIQVR